MKHIINDLNPRSNDLAARINAVDTAFQNLKEAISGYTQTNEHMEREYGTESFLDGLREIEAELASVSKQVETYRLSTAKKLGYEIDYNNQYQRSEPDLIK